MDEGDDIPEEYIPWTQADQDYEDRVNSFDEFDLITFFG